MKPKHRIITSNIGTHGFDKYEYYCDICGEELTGINDQRTPCISDQDFIQRFTFLIERTKKIQQRHNRCTDTVVDTNVLLKYLKESAVRFSNQNSQR